MKNTSDIANTEATSDSSVPPFWLRGYAVWDTARGDRQRLIDRSKSLARDACDALMAVLDDSHIAASPGAMVTTRRCSEYFATSVISFRLITDKWWYKRRTFKVVVDHDEAHRVDVKVTGAGLGRWLFDGKYDMREPLKLMEGAAKYLAHLTVR